MTNSRKSQSEKLATGGGRETTAVKPGNKLGPRPAPLTGRAHVGGGSRGKIQAGERSGRCLSWSVRLQASCPGNLGAPYFAVGLRRRAQFLDRAQGRVLIVRMCTGRGWG